MAQNRDQDPNDEQEQQTEPSVFDCRVRGAVIVAVLLIALILAKHFGWF